MWVYSVLGGGSGVYLLDKIDMVVTDLGLNNIPLTTWVARFNLMNTIEPTAGQSLEYEKRPQWFKDWEKTG
ncbi:protein of unknown function, might belong to Sodium/solute symporter family protein [Moritella yayanosii]|uniref:Uncharacterized protein n=1 Tax=Moritella yayanosii TaxID=69539 RepID=A0A330LL31_9GAMM|nr:protein of unknown function, might belong to Sodium/solute symporter family protein [Moritella yayanosii]